MSRAPSRPPPLPGAVALLDGGFAGAVTWAREGDALRIVTIASLVEGRGVGRALLAAAEAEARAQGAARLVVSTVNSNLRALGFYQVNGYVLAALHADAIAAAPGDQARHPRGRRQRHPDPRPDRPGETPGLRRPTGPQHDAPPPERAPAVSGPWPETWPAPRPGRRGA